MKYICKHALIEDPFRYTLWRRWRHEDTPNPFVDEVFNHRGDICVFCMLNPSTADHEQDDATIRKCVGFADRWGFNAIQIVNLYAYRTRFPDDLKKAGYQIGPKNNQCILDAAGDSSLFVAAWGNHAQDARASEVLDKVSRIVDVYCIGVSKKGMPLHPLMQSYTNPRKLLRARESDGLDSSSEVQALPA